MPVKRADVESGPVRFTNKYLKGLKPKPEQKDCIKFDTECRGLGVRATTSGARRFLVQWTDPVTKRKVREPIGAWGAITIDQARAAARARLGDVARGIDPKAERERRRAEVERERAERTLTLGTLLDQWSALHLVRQSERYRIEAIRAIKRAFPEQLKRPAAQFTKNDAVNGLDRIVRAGKPVMAGRTLEYARAAFRWAEKRGKVPQNPFQNIPAIEGGKPVRDRVLCKMELAEVWVAAGTLPYPWGPFFRLALLTLQRRSEVGEMRWSELSRDLLVWDLTVKAGKPHIVHLPEAGRVILKQLPRLGEFVLTNNGKNPVRPSTFHRRMLLAAIQKLRQAAPAKIESMPALKPWTVHDFRRTGVSKLAELGFDPIVVDKILSHQPTRLRGVAAVYQRYDFAKERKAALAAWAAYITRIGLR
jgi:integrase